MTGTTITAEFSKSLCEFHLILTILINQLASVTETTRISDEHHHYHHHHHRYHRHHYHLRLQHLRLALKLHDFSFIEENDYPGEQVSFDDF